MKKKDRSHRLNKTKTGLTNTHIQKLATFNEWNEKTNHDATKNVIISLRGNQST